MAKLTQVQYTTVEDPLILDIKQPNKVNSVTDNFI